MSQNGQILLIAWELNPKPFEEEPLTALTGLCAVPVETLRNLLNAKIPLAFAVVLLLSSLEITSLLIYIDSFSFCFDPSYHEAHE
jgi:hypothetical protein